MIFKFLLFLVIISVLIFVHEGGHFIVAKRSGIDVEEFMVGVGPVLYSRRVDSTLYTIRALPFGGACRFKGMFDEEEEDEDSWEFAPVWGRIATVFAGPFMNFVLAFFLSLFVVGSLGYDPAVVDEVMDGYPAQEAGLQSGDEITNINGHRIYIYRDISLYMLMNESRRADITYLRDGEKRQTTLVPRYNEESGRYLFGIRGSAGYVKGSVLDTIWYSLVEVRYWIELTFKSLMMLFTGQLGVQDMSGPVGVAQAVGEVYDQSVKSGLFYLWINMMNLTILLSANLGVVNLMPVPALDGGRLVFLFIEAISGRKVNKGVEMVVQIIGACLIILLSAVVLFNDVGRLFQ